MSEFRPTTSAGTALLRAILAIIAVMVFAGGCAIAALTVWDANEHPGLPVGHTVSVALGAMLGGALLAVIALAIGAILRQLSLNARSASRPAEAEDVRLALGRLEQSLRLLNSAQSPPAVAREVAPISGTNLAILLEQIRDYSLMNEDQKNRFAARQWERRRNTLTDLIERDVLVGDWAAAFARLEDLQLLMPEDVRVLELRERVQSEQNARLEEEMRSARAQVREYIVSAYWQQAEDLASQLQRKYLGKTEPQVLMQDIRREREAWERENAEKLFRGISDASGRHQWRAAIQAVEEFIRRYPSDPRAEALRLDLPTLVENAAAQERKEQETHFKDLLKHQRYNEAIAVARAVVQKYPKSATATELNKLLPRVEELARQAAAGPAAQQPVAAGV